MPTALRVLIVSNQHSDVPPVLDALKRGGYEPICQRVDNLNALNAALDRERWDVVIAAHLLPGFSANAALAVLKKRGLNLPFFVLADALDEHVVISTMKWGAHDCFARSDLTRLAPAVERELRHAQERRSMRPYDAEQGELAELCAVFENVPWMMILLDAERRIRRINRAMAEFANWSPSAVIGLRSGEVLRCLYALDDRQGCEFGTFCGTCPVRNIVLDAFEHGKARHHLEARLPIMRGGRQEELELSLSAVRLAGANGQMRVLLCIQDLTEQKRREEELGRSLRALRGGTEAAFQAMALAVESRDPHSVGHQRRVAKLAVAIAEKLGMTEQQIDAIRMAGLIHDVGKISVRVEVLGKPGRVTAAEYDHLKSHSQVGYEILRSVPFAGPVAEIVLQHHERMDGSGYPAGLRAESILMEARVLAVADVIEAMTHQRPHRPALSMEQALQEVMQNKGTLYDPHVVDALMKLVASKEFSFD